MNNSLIYPNILIRLKKRVNFVFLQSYKVIRIERKFEKG